MNPFPDTQPPGNGKPAGSIRQLTCAFNKSLSYTRSHRLPLPESRSFVVCGYAMTVPMGDIRPIFAMPGGGTPQGHIEDIVSKFGKDVTRLWIFMT